MKTKKRMLAGLLTGSMLLSAVPAVAADIDVDVSGAGVIIKETAEPGASLMLMVVKDNEKPDAAANLYAIEYATANADGVATFEFDMPDVRFTANDTEWDAYIKNQATSAETKSDFTYVTVKGRTNLIAKMAEETNAENMKSILNNSANAAALKTLGCNVTAYMGLSDDETDDDRGAVAGLIVAELTRLTELPDFTAITAADIEKTFNDAVSVVSMKNATSGTLSAYLKAVNPEFEGVKYADLTDTYLIDWINKEMSGKSFATMAAFKKFYNNTIMFYNVNNVKVDDVKTVLLKYATDLGLTSGEGYTAYMALSDTSAADTAIVTSLKTNPVNTISDLDNVLKTGAAAISGGGGNGGGGNHSNGGGTGGVAVPPTVDGHKNYVDIDNVAWAKEAITDITSRGIVSGYEDNTFKPLQAVKREEFVKMLMLAINAVSTDAECDFKDVDKSAWYYNYVASAFEKKLINGKSTEIFGIGDYLTRQDMAVICQRALDEADLTAVRTAESFADEAQISEYAKESVKTLYCAGLVNGVGNNMFSPLGIVNRAQAAVLIYNIISK